MPTKPNRRWIHGIVWAKTFAKNNPIVAATFVAGLLGGFTLFVYCLLIGEAPDFTFSEVLGTFVATCLAGFVVVCTLAFMCVAPGALAKYALDSWLPETAPVSHYWVESEQRPELAGQVHSEMRATMLEGPFPLELTCFSVLAWSVWWAPSFAHLCWPVSPVLVVSLHATSLAAVTALVCLGTKLNRTSRNGLRIAIVFGGLTVLALYCIHRLGFPSPEALEKHSPIHSQPPDGEPSTSPHLMVGLYACYVVAAILSVFGTCLSVDLALRGERKRQLAKLHGPQYPGPRPAILPIRLGVAAVYVIASFLPLLVAAQLTDASGPAHETRTFLLFVLYLALFNLLYFSIASLRSSFLNAYLTALGLLFALLMIVVPNPALLPKTIVYALGYGNFHSPLILMSGTECSRLLAYGVSCEGKKDEAIAIKNVNIISRVGSNVTLQLLVRREGRLIDNDLNAEKHIQGSDIAALSDGQSSQQAEPQYDGADSFLHARLSADDFIVRGNVRHLVHARQCDALVESKLSAPGQDLRTIQKNSEIETRLWCVNITIKKESLLDYEKDGWPTYYDGYSRLVEIHRGSAAGMQRAASGLGGRIVALDHSPSRIQSGIR